MTRRLAAFALTTFLAACASKTPSPPPKDASKGLDIPALRASAVAPDTAQVDASDALAPIPVGSDDAVRGPRDAYVTIVLFADFQCPFCARLVTTLDQIREHYSGDVRIVFKNNPLPFHDRAKLAATVGQGVLAARGQDAFWKFHDAVYHRQSDLLTDEGLHWAAADAGLLGAELDAGLAGHTWSDMVERDMALAKKDGATGTPAMFLNGAPISGAQTYERIAGEVDGLIVQAKALAANGVGRDALYRIATAANYKEPAQRKNHDDDAKAAADTKTVWSVPVGGAPVRGGVTALVTIVEFGDYQCPFTKRSETTLEELRKKYGTDLRIVWRDKPLPFHPRAMPAANLARFARLQKGDATFWAVHDALFASQPKLEDADLEGVARTAGIDATRAMTAVKTSTFKSGIGADVDASEEVEATGTPTFFVNGRKIAGAHPASDFESIIDEEIVHARAELAKGVAPAGLYASLIKNGKTVPRPAANAGNAAKAGLIVNDLAMGTGRAAGNGNKLSIHYVGTLADGTEFDSSRKRGAPFSFTLGKGTVIKGFDAGLLGMKVGGRRTLTIPPDLGYGQRSMAKIPAGSTLKFDIELLTIE